MELLKRNLYYLSAGIVFFLGILSLFFVKTGDIVMFFSENRNPTLDTFFYWVTKLGEHFLYIVFLVYFLWFSIKKSVTIPIIGGVVTLVAYIMKNTFDHQRPIRYLAEQGLANIYKPVDGVHMINGLSSFPSGHTMSAFTLLGFVALITKNKKIQILLFVIAFLVAVSRIYLGQHFLKDVIAGGSVGCALAWAIYYLQEKVKFIPDHGIQSKPNQNSV